MKDIFNPGLFDFLQMITSLKQSSALLKKELSSKDGMKMVQICAFLRMTLQAFPLMKAFGLL